LVGWFRERDWKSWDEQIERDFSMGGPGMGLLGNWSWKSLRVGVGR